MLVDEVIEHQEVEQEVQEANEQFESQDDNQVEQDVEEQAEKQVPLSVLQKERKKRQEAEMNAQYQYQQRMEFQNRQQPQEAEDDSEEYESATRQELKRSSKQTKDEAKREIKEELWMEANPEKIELVEKHLDQFLKQRPSYVDAIKNSTNRYKEGYDLIKAFMFNSKPVVRRQQEVKNGIPNSPTTVPKIAAFNGKVDVMRMSDKEFNEWRSSQRKR